MFWNFKQKKILSGIVIVLFAFMMLFPVSFLHAEFSRVPAPENLTAQLGNIFDSKKSMSIKFCFEPKPAGNPIEWYRVVIDGIEFYVNALTGQVSGTSPYPINPLPRPLSVVHEKPLNGADVCFRASGLTFSPGSEVEVCSFQEGKLSLACPTKQIPEEKIDDFNNDELKAPLNFEIESIGNENENKGGLVEQNEMKRSPFFQNLWSRLKTTFVWKTFFSPIISLLDNLFGFQERAAPRDEGRGEVKI